MTTYLRPPNGTPRTRWRRESNVEIQRVFAAHPELVKDPSRTKELRALVSKAYPFGVRQHWPYKVWCDAVRAAFYQLAMQDLSNEWGPLHRKCPACNAKPGVHCKAIHQCEADPIFAHELVIRDAELDGRTADVARLRLERPMHESRNPPPPTMPLFEGL